MPCYSRRFGYIKWINYYSYIKETVMAQIKIPVVLHKLCFTNTNFFLKYCIILPQLQSSLKIL